MKSTKKVTKREKSIFIFAGQQSQNNLTKNLNLNVSNIGTCPRFIGNLTKSQGRVWMMRYLMAKMAHKCQKPENGQNTTFYKQNGHSEGTFT